MEAAYAIARGCPMYHIDPEYDWGITGAMKCAHVVSAVRNTHFHELVPVARGVADLIPPVYACGYSEQVEAMDAGGTLPVPEGPGLRVACDWAYMERLALEQKVFAL